MMKVWLSKIEFAFKKLQDPFKVLSLSVLLLFLFLIFYLVASSISSSIKQKNIEYKNLSKQLSSYKEEIGKLTSSDASSRTNLLLKEEKSKQDELEKINLELKPYQSGFISQKQVFVMLSRLIEDSDGIQLLHLAKRVGKPLIKTNMGSFYEFPVEVTLYGDYSNIYSYFNKIQQKEFSLYLQNMDYKVINYPDAEVKINYRLISMEPPK